MNSFGFFSFVSISVRTGLPESPFWDETFGEETEMKCGTGPISATSSMFADSYCKEILDMYPAGSKVCARLLLANHMNKTDAEKVR